MTKFLHVTIVNFHILLNRSKLEKQRERDVSEKIALGLPNRGGRGGDDTQFDQRLFNTSKVFIRAYLI